jgi:peroxiredoxin
MAQFEPLKAEIENAGAQLAYVTAEKAKGVWKPQKFLASHPLSFAFLLDEDRSVTKAYGLYHRIGLDAVNIARPATFVIDCERNVTYIYRGDNQNDRAPLDQIMAALKKSTVQAE